MLLPVNEISNGFTNSEIQALLDYYPIIDGYDSSHPAIKVKGDKRKIPGVIFDFTKLDNHPIIDVLYNIQKRYPFLNNTVSYIITDEIIPSFNLHSHTDSHCHLLCVLESDNTAITNWYKIKRAPAFLKVSELIGIRPHPDGEVELWHTDTLLHNKTYLFDSHTFHSVNNTNKNKRIVFTWWLEHIAYQYAAEYYKNNDFFVR